MTARNRASCQMSRTPSKASCQRPRRSSSFCAGWKVPFIAPDVNIARVPENGRNFEAFGEDPFLSGQTAVAEIEGIQQNPVIATVKHFAVNSQETNRYYVSSTVDDRTAENMPPVKPTKSFERQP